MTAGGIYSIVLSIHPILDEGDSILLPDPCYSVYWDLARFMGLRVKICLQSVEKGFNPDPERVKEKPRRVVAVLFASLDNPTPGIVDLGVARAIYDIAYKHLVYWGGYV